MTQSGATPSLPVSRDLLRLIAGDSPDWARIGACVRGPLLTVAAVVDESLNGGFVVDDGDNDLTVTW